VTIHVGTAPDSWGVWYPSDERQTPWQRFLNEAAAADYDAIELGPFGYLPTQPSEVAEELHQRGLRLAGGTLSGDLDAADAWDEIRERAAGVCDILAELDAQYVVLLDQAYADGPRDLDEAGWRCLRNNLHRLGEYTASRGIAATFHPHADTTVQYEPQIERLLELTDPALINLCLDLGHHAYAGGDPVTFFEQHHQRVPYLHLKDVDAALASRARAEDWTFGRAVSEGAFVDLGKGCVDLGALNRAARQVGFDGWGIVEQDMYPAPPDKPLPIARRNRAYLREIGMG
jgi:inosose dehydratase